MDLLHEFERSRHWSSGSLEMVNGRLISIRRRWLRLPTSVAQVWLQTHYRPATDWCKLDYRSHRVGGFIVLEYVRSGSRTSLASFRGACRLLDEIARLRKAVAIVAHISTDAISDRLLSRWGWQPHADQLSGRHWIKRFYDGYPKVDVNRYL